jgi:AraC family transcriptional regulator
MSVIAKQPKQSTRGTEATTLTTVAQIGADLFCTAGQPTRRCMLAEWQLRRIERHVEEHLGERMPCAALASMVSLSRSQFGRAFRATTGQTPHAYVMGRRMARAKRLLRETAMPLSEIALECGMADQSHLSRVFSGMEGISPGVWRRIANGRQPERASSEPSDCRV